VLLIACSNVAGILLARAIERRREIATRLALGATPSRILKQLLIEGLILALAAGAVSIPLAFAVVQLLASYQPSLPVPIPIELKVDPRVMTFAMVLSAFCAILFALLPGVRASRVPLAPALHGTHATADRRRSWLRQGLVAGQVAMSLLLLVAAGLFVRSLQRAGSIDPGFDVRGVDTLQIDTHIAGYRTDAEGVRVVESLIDRFKALPGITAVAASRMIPLQGGGLSLGTLRVPGRVGPNGSEEIDADWDVVSPDYFATLQMRIVRGRAFTAQDRTGAPRVAIVNERFAAEAWPGQDPIGKQLIQGADTESRLAIVGVAQMSKYRTINESPHNFIYVPLAQQFLSDVTFYARHSAVGGGHSRINDLRQALIAFDPMLPVVHTQTMEVATTLGLLPQTIAAWVAGTVGVIGLLLSAFGLYGLTAFSVAQRTREIAIRVALGASREGVLWLVLRDAGRLAAVGAAVGLALSALVGSLLDALLIGVQPIDPLAFGVAIALLGSAMAVASIVPARRATSMDPLPALRTE